MRCSRFVGLVFFTAVLVLVFAGSAFAAKTWQVKQLTSAPYNHDNLAISGDRLVWREQTPGAPLWTWTPSETTHTISNDDAIASQPSVDGNRVVWLGYFTATGYSPRVWTAGSGETSIATLYSYTGDVNAPKISGTRVAWVDTPLGETASHVYSRDLSESSVTTVSDNIYSIYDQISLSGNRIAWDCSTDGHSNNIFTRVVGDAGQQQLTTHTGVNDAAYSPEVSGDRVVWVDNVGDWVVRTWTSDGTSMTVGPIAQDYLDPHVSGDRFVWRTPDSNMVGQVTTWKLGDLAPSVLTTGGTSSSYHSFQQVSGDRVVWREWDGAEYHVMTWAVGDSKPTTLSGDYSAHNPVVSGDRVAWQGYVGGKSQIFTAVLAEEPTPTPSPIATSLTRPAVSPSKPKKGKYATFTTYLRPGGGGVGAKVTLKLSQQLTKSERKKVGGKWRTVKVKYWKLRKTININGTGAEKFSTRVKLAYKGSWKAEVSATVAGGYSGPAKPKALTFTVK